MPHPKPDFETICERFYVDYTYDKPLPNIIYQVQHPNVTIVRWLTSGSGNMVNGNVKCSGNGNGGGNG